MKIDGSLTGKKILVTRAQEQAMSLAKKIEKLGGTPIVVPLIAFSKPDHHSVDEELSRLHTYSWIIFTSVNGVKFFFMQLNDKDLHLPNGIKIACVGEKTEAALKEFGYNADVKPNEFVAEVFAKELVKHIETGELVLFPRGNLARDVMVKYLKKYGISIQDVIVYNTVDVPEAAKDIHKLLSEKQIDYITFTSPSTVEHFIATLKDELPSLIQDVKLVGIGPITEKAALKYGIKLDIVASVYTTDGLIQAICESISEE